MSIDGTENKEFIVIVHEKATCLAKLFDGIAAFSDPSETGEELLRDVRFDRGDGAELGLDDEGLSEAFFQLGMKRVFDGSMKRLTQLLEGERWGGFLDLYLKSDPKWRDCFSNQSSADAVHTTLQEIEFGLESWAEMNGADGLNGSFIKDALSAIVHQLGDDFDTEWKGLFDFERKKKVT